MCLFCRVRLVEVGIGSPFYIDPVLILVKAGDLSFINDDEDDTGKLVWLVALEACPLEALATFSEFEAVCEQSRDFP